MAVHKAGLLTIGRWFAGLAAGLLLVTGLAAADQTQQTAESTAIANLQRKCAAWNANRNLPRKATATYDEYLAWLREVERRNPDKNWKQIVTKLHREHQTGDEGIELSLGPLKTTTFINGRDNEGWQSIDSACPSFSPTGTPHDNSPYFVIDKDGELIDITHTYAGIRNDLNRSDSIIGKRIMRAFNTNLGDLLQHFVEEGMWDWIKVPSIRTPLGETPQFHLPNWNIYDKFGHYKPLNQTRGNNLGVTAAEYLSARGYSDTIRLSDLLETTMEQERLFRHGHPQGTNHPVPPPSAESYGGRDCEDEPHRGDGGLSPGFVAVDSYWTLNPEPECREATEEPDLKERIADICRDMKSLLNDAGDDYLIGRIAKAQETMRSVQRRLSQTDMQGHCPDQRTRLANNLPRVDRMMGHIDRITDGLRACEPLTLAEHIRFLAGARNQRLVTLHAQLTRAQPVAVLYTAAKSDFRQGYMDHAESKFRQALSLAKYGTGPTCENIVARIGNNLARISRMKRFDDASKRAIDTCSLGGIGALMGDIRGAENPYLDEIYKRLSNVNADCKQTMGDNACRRDFGANSVADPDSVRLGDITCDCRRGYRFHEDEDGKSKCKSNAEVARLEQQSLNAHCRQQVGAGYYAGPRDGKGNYYCLPTKATANAWCNGQVRGAYAGRIRANGSYQCHVRSAPTARAPTRRARRRATYTQAQRNRDAAAAAAAIGAILQGIDAYQRSRGSGGGGALQ
ncbi:MAG: hypothetical protein AAGD23_11190 [Pseudomonadota bacterium]